MRVLWCVLPLCAQLRADALADPGPGGDPRGPAAGPPAEVALERRAPAPPQLLEAVSDDGLLIARGVRGPSGGDVSVENLRSGDVWHVPSQLWEVDVLLFVGGDVVVAGQSAGVATLERFGAFSARLTPEVWWSDTRFSRVSSVVVAPDGGLLVRGPAPARTPSGERVVDGRFEVLLDADLRVVTTTVTRPER